MLSSRMLPKKSILSLFIVTGLTSLFTGCATFEPMPPEEVAEIRAIHVKSELESDIRYLKIGTTAFNNKSSDIPRTGIPESIVEQFRDELRTRGYQLVETAEKSDMVLVVEGVAVSNEPSGYGVEGPGFFVHILFGMNHGIEAQVGIIARLKDAETGKQRISRMHADTKTTSVKTNAKVWADFSRAEQQLLLGELEALVEGIAAEVLDKTGL